jgi:hypothetical protein
MKTGVDGIVGRLLGLSVDHVVKIWIVGLGSVPYKDSRGIWEAITVPESCLERI